MALVVANGNLLVVGKLEDLPRPAVSLGRTSDSGNLAPGFKGRFSVDIKFELKYVWPHCLLYSLLFIEFPGNIQQHSALPDGVDGPHEGVVAHPDGADDPPEGVVVLHDGDGVLHGDVGARGCVGGFRDQAGTSSNVESTTQRDCFHIIYFLTRIALQKNFEEWPSRTSLT